MAGLERGLLPRSVEAEVKQFTGQMRDTFEYLTQERDQAARIRHMTTLVFEFSGMIDSVNHETSFGMAADDAIDDLAQNIRTLARDLRARTDQADTQAE